jgi:translation elongation factor EF-Ts
MLTKLLVLLSLNCETDFVGRMKALWMATEMANQALNFEKEAF